LQWLILTLRLVCRRKDALFIRIFRKADSPELNFQFVGM
jgi:hypothetical protein